MEEDFLCCVEYTFLVTRRHFIYLLGVVLMYLTSKQLFKRASLFIGAIFVGGMLIFFTLNRASIYNVLVTLDLIPKPEKLTELYFDDAAHLPTSAKSNQVIRFAFVIHNLEATDYQYFYNVSVNANGTRHSVYSGNILVKNDQYYVKYEQFKLLNVPGSQEIVVALTNKQQAIHFRTGA
jgi:hypothetical protein